MASPPPAILDPVSSATPAALRGAACSTPAAPGGAAERRRRARVVGGALSLLFHAAVLSWLGLRAASPPLTAAPADEAPLTVELVRLRPLQPVAAPPASPAPRAAQTAPPREAVVLPRPRPAAPVPRQLTPRPLPLPPVPSAGSARGQAATGAAPGPVGAQPAPGPLPGREMQGDLRGFLRGTVGCSHEEYLHLTPGERARCDAGFATAARTAPAIPLPDDKLAAFARQADANARARARREGSMEDTLPPCPPDMAGSNLGLHCLPPQAHTTVGKF